MNLVYEMKGEILNTFTKEEIVLLIFFKLHAGHLYTWKSSGDRLDYITRNQIDFMSMKIKTNTKTSNNQKEIRKGKGIFVLEKISGNQKS